jgi:hypothetical protein
MADFNRTNLHDNDNPPEAGQRVSGKGSWIDGLPHNFDGWGPKTPDAESADDVSHGDSDLTWSGDVDRHHYVWTFQRARRH